MLDVMYWYWWNEWLNKMFEYDVFCFLFFICVFVFKWDMFVWNKINYGCVILKFLIVMELLKLFKWNN